MEQMMENKDEVDFMQPNELHDADSYYHSPQIDQQSAKQTGQQKNEIKGSRKNVGWGVVAMFLGWGFMLNYFPAYANIHSWWSWVFQVASIVCYVIGVVGAIVELGSAFKNELFTSIFTATLFIVGAVVCYIAAGNTYENSILILILKIGTLIFAMIGVLGICMSVQYLDTSKERMQALSQALTPKSIMTLILSILAFLTVIIPFINTILPFFIKR